MSAGSISVKKYAVTLSAEERELHPFSDVAANPGSKNVKM
jgi:hypothetical protein